MSLADVTSTRSSPVPPCPECDATASVTSDLHKYQVACTCKPGSVQYACADEPGPPPPAKTDTPPALPPRPPTNALTATNRRNHSSVGCNGQDATCRRRKYAWWCVGCGALAAALGGLLAAQHIVVRAYTASPHHLETVPAAVPAAMLVLTGVCIMSLARRRNRYSYMIKVVGACCLMCALTCVLVTITTTVIHMNKLQTLKFCEYTQLTRTCTCFSASPQDPHTSDDEGIRCVFEGVTECGVVHGALYWCLRGVFALSVTAVLVCIFSCMLAYQLLSHERKKMYWEQLELRCRSLYRAPTLPAVTNVQSTCNCCTQCQTQPGWDISLQHRFWAPGRLGNLYSPTPGARKPGAWSWFPWPRGHSHNSRHRMTGVPQSGDSAYGFCETDAPQQYTYPATPGHDPAPGGFRGNYPEGVPGSFQSQANFPSQQSYGPSQSYPPYEPGACEPGGHDQRGVWGPPPPYSPQGRGGNRHLHQDPATATLLHHHHIDAHANVHTCTRNYMHNDNRDLNRSDLNRSDLNRSDLNRSDFNRSDLNRSDLSRSDLSRSDLSRSDISRDLTRNDITRAELNRSDIIRADINRDMSRSDLNRADMIRSSTEIRNQDIIHANEIMRVNQELLRANPELLRANPELLRANPELLRANPELLRANPELLRASADLIRANPEMGHMMQYSEEIEMSIQDGRFNTLRGQLVPYRCQRGISANNLHRDCENHEREVPLECMHQKSASKVSDQSSDSCQKQGKENLGFQNDKHSPLRSADCRGNQNAESEVYFADVSSCCNVSIKAECCMNNVLVGTIEAHPDTTSESEGSFTLTRSQRPQPSTSKRRPKHTHKDKHTLKPEKHTIKPEKHTLKPARFTEHQIELSLRMNERNDSRDRLNERIERLNDSRSELDRMNDSRISERMNETRLSDRLNDRFERMNDCRISERLNDSRLDRMNESRLDRLNESRISERMNDPRDRMNDSRDRMNDSRLERNEPRIDRFNESRVSERMNDSRISDRIERNEPRIRMNESDRMSERLNESRISDRFNESRVSDRMNDSRINRLNESERMSERLSEPRIRMNESDRSDRMNDSRLSDINERSDRIERMTDLNSSFKLEGSPKVHNIRKKELASSPKPEFFVPPPPLISPLSPNTEESLLSDDDRPQVYSNTPESSKCLGPDSQYDKDKEILKTNHHHCYSDTNTMDSGWQSGSEKQVTD